MNTKDWITQLEAARVEELNNPRVDLTLVCGFDSAINDLRQCTDELADVVMAIYHTRAMQVSLS
jgi:hypothetical protein